MILNYCEGIDGFSSLDSVEFLVCQKMDKENVDLMDEYLKEKFAFEEGKFTCEGLEITGEVPDEFLGEGRTVWYSVAQGIFGTTKGGKLDNCYIERKNGRKILKIYYQDLFPEDPSQSPITEKREALNILKTLIKYAK